MVELFSTRLLPIIPFLSNQTQQEEKNSNDLPDKTFSLPIVHTMGSDGNEAVVFRP